MKPWDAVTGKELSPRPRLNPSLSGISKAGGSEGGVSALPKGLSPPPGIGRRLKMVGGSGGSGGSGGGSIATSDAGVSSTRGGRNGGGASAASIALTVALPFSHLEARGINDVFTDFVL